MVTTYTQNPLDITMDRDYILVAVFVPVTHKLTVQTSGPGKTDPAAGVYTVNQGSTVTVTAKPDPGAAFDHWELT